MDSQFKPIISLNTSQATGYMVAANKTEWRKARWQPGVGWVGAGGGALTNFKPTHFIPVNLLDMGK